MTTQGWMWTADGARAGAGGAGRRGGMARATGAATLDATGWVPWRGIQVAAFFAVLLLAMLALKA